MKRFSIFLNYFKNIIIVLAIYILRFTSPNLDNSEGTFGTISVAASFSHFFVCLTLIYTNKSRLINTMHRILPGKVRAYAACLTIPEPFCPEHYKLLAQQYHSLLCDNL